MAPVAATLLMHMTAEVCILMYIIHLQCIGIHIICMHTVYMYMYACYDTEFRCATKSFIAESIYTVCKSTFMHHTEFS